MSESPSLVSSYTEWDPLEEVIVGRALNARIARPDRGLFAVEYQSYGSVDQIPSGPYPDRVIAQTEEDLEALVETFRKLGVVVRRPEIWDHSQTYRSPDWETDGKYNYCPRDLFFVSGNWLIEAPMTLRADSTKHSRSNRCCSIIFAAEPDGWPRPGPD